jgi:hypothetical protein
MKKLMFLMALATVLAAWRSPGGDSFELYVQDKLIVRYFYASKTPVPTVRLGQDAVRGTVALTFSHCGRTDTQRQITARDASGKVIKVWSFPNAGGKTGNRMTLTWDGIQKRNPTMSLYYQAQEFPDEALLAHIIFTDEAVTARATH